MKFSKKDFLSLLETALFYAVFICAIGLVFHQLNETHIDFFKIPFTT